MTQREYPERPLVGVGGLVVRDGRVLLVKRAREPLKDKWSLPGGLVELGETLESAVVREIREETGLEVNVEELVDVVDRILRDENGRAQYHYVLADYLCTAPAGEPRAASDVAATAWATVEDLPGYGIAGDTARVIRQGLALAVRHRPPSQGS